jgi:carboxyl-terminal processing protease
VQVRVGTAEQEFQIGDVEALWAVGPHVREVFRFINRNTEITEEEQRKAEYAIVAGVLGTLDPHTNLLEPDDFADMKASTKGSFGGLGIEVGMRDGAITVIRVISGNPASKVDMQPGDRIVQIDAESTVTMTLNEAVGRLRGPPGTTVNCHVMRDGLEAPKKLAITRATIKLDSVIGDVLQNTDASGKTHKVGLVAIPRNFAQTTGKELRAKLNEFEREGVEGVILDLRDNPGGLLNAAVEVADAFVSSGTIVSTVGHGTPREESKADDRYDFGDKPLVVLVDQGSASASEIVAGALRNLGRAVVIGRRTFGKGSVQVLHERKVADKELALKLTIAQYLTPGDVSIQSVGVSPDLETMPVWIGDDQIYYFGRGRFDLLREESLAAHLESKTAKSEKIAFGPLHFLDRGSVEAGKKKAGEADKAKPKPEKEPADGDKRTAMLLEDPEVRIARDLLLWAPSSDRDEVLAKLNEFVDQQEELEQKHIASSLASRGIDWSLGAKPASGTSAKLSVKVKSDKPGNVIKGGESGTVTVTVTNSGTAPAYQVRAITDSDYRYFDERELLFGKIEPGASKSFALKLSVSEHELSRTDRVDFHLFEQHGAKLAEGSSTQIDISAEGLPRPQFAYGYQVIDDPSLGSKIKGNGDGVMQVGERVKLRVNVANHGEGPALDTWVTLRNLSGEAVFLHSGRERLKQMQPGDHRVVDLDVEINEAPEFGEADLQLTVSDNKIAEALSEKIVFDVRDEGVQLDPVKTGVAADGELELYSAPTPKAHIVGRAAEGAKFQATAKTADWYRVDLGDGVFAFAKAGEVKKLGKSVSKPGKVELAYIVSPPLISLMGTVSHTEEKTVHFSGVATDQEAVRDVFITVYNPSRNLFGSQKKVFYQASTDPTSGKLEFAADVPLTPGNNIIEVHAREDDDVVAVRRMWVLRTSGLAEARAKGSHFATNGQLRVDTFK